MHLRQRYQEKIGTLVFRRPLTIQTAAPLISFTFDDFPRTAWLEAGAILKRAGLSATYYVSLGLLGTEAPTGQITTVDDVRSVLEQGHELGCHTFSHCDPVRTAPEQYEASIIENRVALERVLPGASFKSFAYPIGSPRPFAKARAARHFICCRAGGQRINSGTVDLNHLSAFFLEKTQGRIQAVKDLIDKNRECRGWLILATHDVCEHHSRFGCTPGFFEEVVCYALRSGARILPVVHAVHALWPGNPWQDRSVTVAAP